MDQAVDFRMVGALHLPDIPLQFLAYPSESRQMPGGSEGTEGSSRPGEIGARFCAVLTGVNQVMNRTPVSSRQSFGRNREVLDPLFGQELPTPTRAAYRNHALLSNEEGVFIELDVVLPLRFEHDLGHESLVVVAVDFDRSHVATSAELPTHHIVLGILFLAASPGIEALDTEFRRLTKFKSPEEGIQVVTGHVAHRASAELTPGPPTEWVQAVVKVALWGRPQPLVPMDPTWHRLTDRATTAPAKVSPQKSMYLGDFSDRASPDILAHLTNVFAKMALVAHLSENLFLLCGLR